MCNSDNFKHDFWFVLLEKSDPILSVKTAHLKKVTEWIDQNSITILITKNEISSINTWYNDDDNEDNNLLINYKINHNTGLVYNTIF